MNNDNNNWSETAFPSSKILNDQINELVNQSIDLLQCERHYHLKVASDFSVNFKLHCITNIIYI